MPQKPTVRLYVPLPPFPITLIKSKNEEENKEILKINIFLLKELFTNKRKLKGDKKISVWEMSLLFFKGIYHPSVRILRRLQFHASSVKPGFIIV